MLERGVLSERYAFTVVLDGDAGNVLDIEYHPAGEPEARRVIRRGACNSRPSLPSSG